PEVQHAHRPAERMLELLAEQLGPGRAGYWRAGERIADHDDLYIGLVEVGHRRSGVPLAVGHCHLDALDDRTLLHLRHVNREQRYIAISVVWIVLPERVALYPEVRDLDIGCGEIVGMLEIEIDAVSGLDGNGDHHHGDDQAQDPKGTPHARREPRARSCGKG